MRANTQAAGQTPIMVDKEMKSDRQQGWSYTAATA
jgi:hypothetical protein